MNTAVCIGMYAYVLISTHITLHVLLNTVTLH